jgi:hypothetical protein
MRMIRNSVAFWFFVCLLAVWRTTHLLHAEDGPWQILDRLRRLAGESVIGRIFGCFYCLSLWVAFPFTLLLAINWTEGICLWLGLSGGAILVHRATEWRVPTAPSWKEDMSNETDKVEEKSS